MNKPGFQPSLKGRALRLLSQREHSRAELERKLAPHEEVPGELAKAQFAKGADVVFAAAGGTGMGVYQAAKDSGKLAIGVDSNQNHLQPGTMLTSMLKRVDVAVYNVAKAHKGGISVLGLKEGGVDYAMDDNNAKLVTADMKKKVDAAKADIISGKIKVADYMADNACKY